MEGRITLTSRNIWDIKSLNHFNLCRSEEIQTVVSIPADDLATAAFPSADETS